MSYDPTDIRAQDRERAMSAQQRKLAEKIEAEDMRWLMGTKRGRRIVWRSLERAGVFRSSFNTNAMSMAFAEGMRNEGLRTVGLLNAACPDLYLTMVREANERHLDDGGNGSQHQREHDHLGD